MFTILCSTRKGVYGSQQQFGHQIILTSARKVLIIHQQSFPVDKSYRQLGMYDPKTGKYTPINTCFSTHHLMFAEDDNNTLWTSGGGAVVGWLDTKTYLETGDEKAAQGWTPLILDFNGTGKRDAYTEPDSPDDPKKDKRIAKGLYACSPAPDGSVWGSYLSYPGALIRLKPGANPAETALAEYFELPLNEKGEPVEGFSPRGMDVDRSGWPGSL
jgi:hypothetical protein